jgi:hypothetical protein
MAALSLPSAMRVLFADPAFATRAAIVTYASARLQKFTKPISMTISRYDHEDHEVSQQTRG